MAAVTSTPAAAVFLLIIDSLLVSTCRRRRLGRLGPGLRDPPVTHQDLDPDFLGGADGAIEVSPQRRGGQIDSGASVRAGHGLVSRSWKRFPAERSQRKARKAGALIHLFTRGKHSLIRVLSNWIPRVGSHDRALFDTPNRFDAPLKAR
jgi:hypothetical protein